MSNGFERRKEQSKEEIRRATWELFAQFGVERVSMADIPRKAGVSQATIYNNFGSKETLAGEFVAIVVDGLVDGIEQVLAPEMPFHEKLAAFANYIGDTTRLVGPLRPGRLSSAAAPTCRTTRKFGRSENTAREKMTGLMLRLAAEGRVQETSQPEPVG